jgi:predicted peptidase
MEYLLYVPEDYEEDRAWPLILSLHGFLGADPTLESVRTQNPVAWVDPSEFPFVLVAPKGPDGLWSEYHEPMDELFDVLGDSLSIDPEAVFLTGLSSGTLGVWPWALARPDLFAGIAPIAGGPPLTVDQVSEDICGLVDLPIWMAHSEADEVVPIDSDVATVAGLEECGSTAVRFTTYEGLTHVESISTAYAGPDLYEWMLEQVP